MKTFWKENFMYLLCLIFLSLLFILWGRIVAKELRANAYTKQLTTLEARLLCLEHYGWEVDPGSETRKTVSIPDPLDSVYEEYNKLQTVSGFDVNRFRGRTAECYTYIALNFPYETEETVYVNLLICEGTLIAGDCMTTALDGFMLPLDRRYLP